MRFSVSAALIVTVALLPAGASAQSGDGAAADGAGSGKPANLCRELVAFVHPPAPEKGDPQPAQLATAVQAPKQGSAESKPSAEGTPQNTSGQSGQMTASGPGAAGPQGATQSRLSDY